MGQSFFIWKDMDCRAMGVWLSGPLPIVRPEERVRHIQIPGMEGDLTQLEGENIFNSYIQTATILVKNGSRVREIYNWLKGSGFVTFSGEPDRKQPARIIGAITLNKHSRNLDWWTGEVQFYCQPLKERLTEETGRYTSGSEIYNRGDITARPIITVNGTGAGPDLQFSINGQSFRVNLTGMADTGCVIDCQAQIVTNYAKTADLTGLSEGNFPVLVPGTNAITFTNGITNVDILKRERFL